MLRAIIFDCDGVICDSEPIHYEAFAAVLGRGGLSLSRADYYEHCLGFDDQGVFDHAYEHAGRELDSAVRDELLAGKQRMFLELIQKRLVPLPGVQQFVRAAAQRWPLAVCSGALRREVEYIVEQLGLKECFSAIVTADDLSANKPDPEGYLRSLRLLQDSAGLDPLLEADECLVIEDSLPGIAAGHAAGMRVLAVTTSHAAEQLGSAEAVVGSLAEVDLASVEALFNARSR